MARLIRTALAVLALTAPAVIALAAVAQAAPSPAMLERSASDPLRTDAASAGAAAGAASAIERPLPLPDRQDMIGALPSSPQTCQQQSLTDRLLSYAGRLSRLGRGPILVL
ncbi:hypothetical protein [Parapedomonas caeni]|jgi:hypothetical protein